MRLMHRGFAEFRAYDARMSKRRIKAAQRVKTYLGPWLAEKGVSRAELAIAMDCDVSTVTRYVNGTTRMSPDALTLAAGRLGIEPVDLYRLPSDRSADAMLAGLDPEVRQRIISTIEHMVSLEKK